jgi:hypothetical protein
MLSFACSSTVLTPVRPTPLAGYAGRLEPHNAIHSQLEANILVAFEEDKPACAVVSIDALFVGLEISNALLGAFEQHGLSQERVLILASHTHFAPALETTKPQLGKADPSHIAWVRFRLLAAVEALMRAPRFEASVAIGHEAGRFSVNRRRRWPLPRLGRRGLDSDSVVMAPNPSGRTNETVTAIVLRAERQNVVLWHYTCHPVGFPLHGHVSAEFPGVVRARLRSMFGAETSVVFLQGFCGDIRPDCPVPKAGLGASARYILKGPGFGSFSYSEWESWSSGIADVVEAAVRAASECVPGRTTGASRTDSLARLFVNAPSERSVGAQRILFLGAVPIVAVTAEPLIDLSDLCPRDALHVGYSRDVFGYWPRTRQLREGGYEVNGFRSLFAVPYSWTTDPDREFCSLLLGADGA